MKLWIYIFITTEKLNFAKMSVTTLLHSHDDVDSLATLITMVSTSTSRCHNNFCAMEWQFCTDILQGVDIPAGKKICETGDFRKIVQEDFCRELARNAHICLGFHVFIMKIVE